MKACVLSGDEFGTMRVLVPALKRDHVNLWVGDAELAKTMNVSKENVKYLPGVTIPDKIT